jgi:hypothetical protein
MRHEAGRLQFLERRDGLPSAVAFAHRALDIYRAAARRGKDGRRSAYGGAYRRVLLESGLDFRAYLRRHAG